MSATQFIFRGIVCTYISLIFTCVLFGLCKFPVFNQVSYYFTYCEESVLILHLWFIIVSQLCMSLNLWTTLTSPESWCKRQHSTHEATQSIDWAFYSSKCSGWRFTVNSAYRCNGVTLQTQPSVSMSTFPYDSLCKFFSTTWTCHHCLAAIKQSAREL